MLLNYLEKYQNDLRALGVNSLDIDLDAKRVSFYDLSNNKVYPHKPDKFVV